MLTWDTSDPLLIRSVKENGNYGYEVIKYRPQDRSYFLILPPLFSLVGLAGDHNICRLAEDAPHPSPLTLTRDAHNFILMAVAKMVNALTDSYCV